MKYKLYTLNNISSPLCIFDLNLPNKTPQYACIKHLHKNEIFKYSYYMNQKLILAFHITKSENKKSVKKNLRKKGIIICIPFCLKL